LAKLKISSIRNKVNSKLLYTQASKYNLNNIVNIKEVFPNLFVNKIAEVQKVIDNKSKKNRPKINIMMKDPFRKQVIIPMFMNSAKKVIINTNNHNKPTFKRN